MSKDNGLTLAETLEQGKKNKAKFAKKLEQSADDYLDRLNETNEDIEDQREKKSLDSESEEQSQALEDGLSNLESSQAVLKQEEEMFIEKRDALDKEAEQFFADQKEVEDKITGLATERAQLDKEGAEFNKVQQEQLEIVKDNTAKAEGNVKLAAEIEAAETKHKQEREQFDKDMKQLNKEQDTLQKAQEKFAEAQAKAK